MRRKKHVNIDKNINGKNRYFIYLVQKYWKEVNGSKKQ